MLESLVETFSELEDPRCDGKVVHRLVNILVVAVCALIAGAESWEDIALYGKLKREWLASFLEDYEQSPSHDTFRRVFMLINPDGFEEYFMKWVANFSPTEERDVIAVDGKTMRQSFDRRKNQGPFHLVSAFSTERAVILGQKQVANKSNEITAIPALLGLLSLKNSIVTIDAMGCQRAIAEKILAKGADYILALKGNQKSIHQAVVSYCDTPCFQLEAAQKPASDFFDDSHGRVVRRRVFACQEACELAPLKKWPGLRQVLAIETTRSPNGTASTQTDIRYFLSSCADPVEKQAQAIRRHWHIENRVHWVLDMSFREDDCRIREKTSARSFAVLRKIAINLIRQDKSSRVSLKGRRKQSAWSDEYMKQILFGQFHA